MKNLFGQDRKNKKSYSDDFIIRSLDEQSQAEHEEIAESAVRPISKLIPRPLIVIAAVCFFMGLIALCTPAGVERAEEWKIVAPIAIAGGCLTAFGTAVFITYLIRLKKLFKTPGFIDLTEKLEQSEKLCYKKLDVPDGAEDILILIAPDNKKNPMFATDLKKVFRENGNLCFADPDAVYAVPIKDIAVSRIDRRTAFSPNYAENIAEITRRLDGSYSVPYRYSLGFRFYKDEYEIVIPSFEIDKIIKYIDPQD